jgi:hypothetical protein
LPAFFLPVTSDAAPLAVATTAPAATWTILVASEGSPRFPVLAVTGFVAGTAVSAAGSTFLGAALPKAGFFAASLERWASSAPVPAFERAEGAFFGAGFFALVAMEISCETGKIAVRP